MSIHKSYSRQDMWTKEEKKQAWKLKEQGYKYREIAQQIGRTYRAVGQYFNLHKEDGDIAYREFIRRIERPGKSRDPRSIACQAIKICNGKGCYRAEKCPAHAAYLSKHQSSDELKIAI